MTHPYIIGISGGSGSGKTYLLNRLMDLLPLGRVTLISQDHYYHPRDTQPRDDEGFINFDHPEAFDLDRFEVDLGKLRKGESVKLQEYTYGNPNIIPRHIEFRPAPLIVVEGLFVYQPENLQKLIDLKVFVEADEHVRLIRRLQRDQRERGYSFESIVEDYRRYVAPMYQKHVAPLRSISDLIIPNNHHIETAVQVLVHHLTHEVGQRQ